MKRYGVIYVYTNIVNGKQYVGQTAVNDHLKYINNHVKAAESGYNKVFYSAIRKYGSESFMFEVIWTAFDKKSLDDAEDHFIMKELRTISPHGDNMRGGGSHGKHSEESKAKSRATRATPEFKEKFLATISAPEFIERRKIKAKEIWPKIKDIVTSPEARAKQRASLIATITDPEYKEFHKEATKIGMNKPEVKKKLADAWTDERKSDLSIKFTGEGNPRFGEVVSKETRDKMSESHKDIEKTLEWRNNLSKSLSGKSKTPEHKVNISVAKTGKSPPLIVQQRAAESNLGSRWINDGKCNRKLKKEDTLPINCNYGMLENSARRGEKNHAFGKKLSPERRSQCASFTGKTHTEETKRKMSIARKNFWEKRRKDKET